MRPPSNASNNYSTRSYLPESYPTSFLLLSHSESMGSKCASSVYVTDRVLFCSSLCFRPLKINLVVFLQFLFFEFRLCEKVEEMFSDNERSWSTGFSSLTKHDYLKIANEFTQYREFPSKTTVNKVCESFETILLMNPFFFFINHTFDHS